jgi:hypothetical protein
LGRGDRLVPDRGRGQRGWAGRVHLGPWFSHTPGTTLNNDTGDVADDHYHRWLVDGLLAAGIDPQFGRGYPTVLAQVLGSGFEAPSPADLQEIATPIDFIGVNNYYYQPPTIYITENGAAFDDHSIDSRVPDPRRQAYLESHIVDVQRAIGDGVPVKGYFVWSLLNNFEWALGYAKRFGVIYVDYATQERLINDSGHWYAQVRRSQSI